MVGGACCSRSAASFAVDGRRNAVQVKAAATTAMAPLHKKQHQLESLRVGTTVSRRTRVSPQRRYIAPMIDVVRERAAARAAPIRRSVAEMVCSRSQLECNLQELGSQLRRNLLWKPARA